MFERIHYSLRSQSDFTLFSVRTECFKNYFFPSVTKMWNDLNTSIRNLQPISRYKGFVRYFNPSSPTLSFIVEYVWMLVV